MRPVFPDLLEQMQQVAPQAVIVVAHGSTEAEPMASYPSALVTEADVTDVAGKGLLARYR